MSEREEQLERELQTESEFDFTTDLSQGESAQRSKEQHTSDSKTGRVRSRLGSLVNTRGVAVATLLSIVGIFVVGLIPLVPAVVSSLLGILLGVFLYGTISSSQQYVESGLAGVLVGAGSVLWSYFPLSIFGASTTLLGIGVVGGLVAGVAGHYFGRDLRDGLTQDIEQER